VERLPLGGDLHLYGRARLQFVRDGEQDIIGGRKGESGVDDGRRLAGQRHIGIGVRPRPVAHAKGRGVAPAHAGEVGLGQSVQAGPGVACLAGGGAAVCMISADKGRRIGQDRNFLGHARLPVPAVGHRTLDRVCPGRGEDVRPVRGACDGSARAGDGKPRDRTAVRPGVPAGAKRHLRAGVGLQVHAPARNRRLGGDGGHGDRFRDERRHDRGGYPDGPLRIGPADLRIPVVGDAGIVDGRRRGVGHGIRKSRQVRDPGGV